MHTICQHLSNAYTFICSIDSRSISAQMQTWKQQYICKCYFIDIVAQHSIATMLLSSEYINFKRVSKTVRKPPEKCMRFPYPIHTSA